MLAHAGLSVLEQPTHGHGVPLLYGVGDVLKRRDLGGDVGRQSGVHVERDIGGGCSWGGYWSFGCLLSFGCGRSEGSGPRSTNGLPSSFQPIG